MTKLSEKIAAIHWRVWAGVLGVLFFLQIIPDISMLAFLGGPESGAARFQRYFPVLAEWVSARELRNFLLPFQLPAFGLALYFLLSYSAPEHGGQLRRHLSGLILLLVGVVLIDTIAWLPLISLALGDLSQWLILLSSVLWLLIVTGPATARLLRSRSKGTKITTSQWWELTAAAIIAVTVFLSIAVIVTPLLFPASGDGAYFIGAGPDGLTVLTGQMLSGTIIKSVATPSLDAVFWLVVFAVIYRWLDLFLGVRFSRPIAALHWALLAAGQLTYIVFTARMSLGSIFLDLNDAASHLPGPEAIDALFARVDVMVNASFVLFAALLAEGLYRRLRGGANPTLNPAGTVVVRRWAAAIFTAFMVLNVLNILVVMAL